MMKKSFPFLMVLLLLFSAFPVMAEDEPLVYFYPPIPWEEKKAPYAPHQEGFLPDNGGYHDDSLDIRIETFRRDDTTVMAAYVTISDPTQLRTGTAADKYPSQKTAPVSAMSKQYQAVLGVNGDYFAYHAHGIVVRNKRTIRMHPSAERDTLVIDDKGDFTILSPTTQEAYDAVADHAVHAFCFGPGLVIDGKAMTDLDTVKVDNGKDRKTQRIAIGQTGPLQYLILTCEGPENQGSVGFDLLQMAQLCQEMGCINAYNLDGGSSCTITLDHKKINALSSRKIRYVSDCIYFATLVP